MPPRTSRSINRDKKRVLRELLNFDRPTQIKTAAGFKKIFNTTNAQQTYTLMDELIGMVVITEPDMDKLKNTLYVNNGRSLMVRYVLDLEGNEPISYDAWRQKTTNPKLVKFNLQGGEIKYVEYEIPKFNNIEEFESWWNEGGYKWKWMLESDTDIFNYYDNTGKLYFYPKKDTLINYNRIRQSFLDGVHHCVFTPIYEWAERHLANSQTDSTRKKYNAIINKINKKYLKKYNNGVPENDMELICKDLNIRIEIHYPYCEEYKIYGSSLIKPRFTFEYLNTRFNHLEPGKLFYNSHITEISTQDEMIEIEERLINENNDYCFILNDENKKTMIQTISTKYILIDNFMKCMKELEEKYGMEEMKICDIHDKELSNFILNGTHYNQHLCKINDNRNSHMKMIDMKKAYYNFKQSPYYKGFLGKITDFRKTDSIQGIGLYFITDISFRNCLLKNRKKFVELNNLMCIYKNDNIYTSIELEYLSNMGITYKIKYGCWGIKPLDFEFGEEFLEKSHQKPFVNEEGETEFVGISHYAKATGFWDRHNLKTKIRLYGNEEYAQAIQENTLNQVYTYNDGLITIEINKKKNNHLGHITAFILAYQRLAVIDQLLEMDLQKVHFVNVDGIFYDEHKFTLNNLFREKDIDGWEEKVAVLNKYITRQNEYHKCDFSNKLKRKHFTIEAFSGAGGCGKTHVNLTDEGLIRKLYVAPSNKLCATKFTEYNIVSKTIACITLSKNPEVIKKIKQDFNVLIIDEGSMISNEEKDLIIDTYNNMKIIFCGDFKHQLPCIEGSEFNFDRIDNITTLTENHRCKCKKLYELLEYIRNCIDNKINIINVFNKIYNMNHHIIKKENVKELYNKEDMILTYTKNEWKEYTEMLKDKGDKYMVIKNNKFHNNGDILFEIPNAPYEVRHAFTTHSIQGETANHKLFIELNKMDCNRLLYTAISRAKTLEQIYFIF